MMSADAKSCRPSHCVTPARPAAVSMLLHLELMSFDSIVVAAPGVGLKLINERRPQRVRCGCWESGLNVR